MEKICFVYGDDVHPRSPMTGCKRMAELFDGSAILADSVCDYEKMRDEGYRIFCYGHKPQLYRNRKLTKGCLADIVNCRAEWASISIGIKCMSGFSYWQRHMNLYDCFFPTITSYERPKEPTTTCIGYYSRDIRPDTTRMFIDMANKVPADIPVIVMGTDIELERDHIFTQNEDFFFSNVTHYFYMKSSYHDDPWPHTLLQACQCGCSVIMPNVQHDWKDGVDDVLEICNVKPINSLTIKYPWDINKPCLFAPDGYDFLPLYEKIVDSKWSWLPNGIKTLSDLYNRILAGKV